MNKFDEFRREHPPLLKPIFTHDKDDDKSDISDDIPPRDLKKIFRMADQKLKALEKQFNTIPHLDKLLQIEDKIRRRLDLYLEMYNGCVDKNNSIVSELIEQHQTDYCNLNDRMDYLSSKVDSLQTAIQKIKTDIRQIHLDMSYCNVDNMKEFYNTYFRADYQDLKKEIELLKKNDV